MSMNFLRNRRALGIAAVTAALLVPLGVFGAPALARSAAAASEYQYGGGSQYQYKITICHHTHSKKHPNHTIRVSVKAWKAHQRHGDTLGACTAPTTTTTTTTTTGTATTAVTPTAAPGKSGEPHGNSGEPHGNSGGQHGNSGANGQNNGHG